MAIAAGLAALGQGKVGAAACEGMARNPGCSSWNSAGADSWSGLHRVAGAVRIGYHLRQGRLSEAKVSVPSPIFGWGFSFSQLVFEEKRDGEKGFTSNSIWPPTIRVVITSAVIGASMIPSR